VENGSKGVQAAKAGQIDLVIMDVGLPDIDGRSAGPGSLVLKEIVPLTDRAAPRAPPVDRRSR
jgi:DNA-binding NarL/FixJ family response regulator